MVVRGRDFNDIYDLVGVRILVDSVRDCYATLGIVHARWSPRTGTLQRTTSRCRSTTCTNRCIRR